MPGQIMSHGAVLHTIANWPGSYTDESSVRLLISSTAS
jgi:hypothetical protein